MATYRDALDPMPEIGLGNSHYDPSRVIAPTLPSSIQAQAAPMQAALATQPTGAPTGSPSPAPNAPPATGPSVPTGYAPVPTGYTPPQTPAQPQYGTQGEAALSQLVDELDKNYGIKLGTDWRDTFQRDPNGFIQYLEQIAANPARYGNVYGTYGSNPGPLTAWLQRVKQAVGVGQTPDFAGQRNAIYDEAKNRLEGSVAASGRSGEEELLSALASRGLLDSGIGARELGSYRMGQSQMVDNALSQLNQELLQSGLNVSSQEYLQRLLSGLNLQNQMQLLDKQAQLQKQSQPSPWWNIGGDVIGAVGNYLTKSKAAPVPTSDYSRGAAWDPVTNRYVAIGYGPPAPTDPYGLGQ